jgi:hypothetical protein
MEDGIADRRSRLGETNDVGEEPRHPWVTIGPDPFDRVIRCAAAAAAGDDESDDKNEGRNPGEMYQ